MPADHQLISVTDLNVLAQQLLERARKAPAQRAATTIYGDRHTLLRHTALALSAGTELAEHNSPPEATLQVLTGKIRLIGENQVWELSSGAFVEIASGRHSVSAVEDSVFLLTVRRRTTEK